MTEGSPTYKAERANIWNKTADMFRKITGAGQQGLFQSGHGFAPSGTGAALAGSMQRQAGKTASDLLFQNLVENEKFKQRGAELGLAGSDRFSSLLGTELNTAQSFNPGAMLGGGYGGSGQQPQQSSPWAGFFTNFGSNIGKIGDIFGGKK
ncbi:MAG: hypothetical protein J3T61_03185 [Candidatus Brocadiales bacterium]|nr:hypothetical protein [Candidatus Bathyanammoxibius sp.]